MRLLDVMWKACRCRAQRAERDRLDWQYEDGYRRLPEDPALADAQARMIAEILEEERW